MNKEQSIGEVDRSQPGKEDKKPVHARPSLYAYYFELLKVVAKQYGYCLLLHGSMNRDLDLVAVPWTNGAHACDIKKMINEMAEIIGSNDILPPHSDKEYGRQQWVINVDRGGYFKDKVDGVPNYAPDPQYYIDISVFQAQPSQPVQHESVIEYADRMRSKYNPSQSGEGKECPCNGWCKGVNDKEPEGGCTQSQPPLTEQGKEEAFGGKEVSTLDLIEKIRKLEGELYNLKSLPKESSEETVEIRKALLELVSLKVIKDNFGKTAEYEVRQPKAWETARNVLLKYPLKA